LRQKRLGKPFVVGASLFALFATFVADGLPAVQLRTKRNLRFRVAEILGSPPPHFS